MSTQKSTRNSVCTNRNKDCQIIIDKKHCLLCKLFIVCLEETRWPPQARTIGATFSPKVVPAFSQYTSIAGEEGGKSENHAKVWIELETIKLPYITHMENIDTTYFPVWCIDFSI
jgi:hypothetical protein